MDFSFRPETYWVRKNPIDLILSNIKGEQRRQLARKLIEVGCLDDPGSVLVASQVTSEQRAALGAIHPAWLGGEYLPPDLPGETTIVRIAMRTVTSDVIEIRARPADRGAFYRIVDEYHTEIEFEPRWSQWPLTMMEVIDMIDSARGIHAGYGNIVTGALAANFGHPGADPKQAAAFIRVESDVYPELEAWYRLVIEEWIEEEMVS